MLSGRLTSLQFCAWAYCLALLALTSSAHVAAQAKTFETTKPTQNAHSVRPGPVPWEPPKSGDELMPFPPPRQAPYYPPVYGQPDPLAHIPSHSHIAPTTEPTTRRPPVRLRPGAYQHQGLFLRLSIGVGAGGASYDERLSLAANRSHIRTRGFAGNLQVSVGGRVFDNFILHGHLLATSMTSKRTVDGVENRTYPEVTTSMLLIGGGATYYFMPTNLHLTLAVGPSYVGEERKLERDSNARERIESGTGIGTVFTVGKEWWVGGSGEWAIGGALTGVFAAAPIDIDGQKSWLQARNISLNFTTTFN